MNLRSIMNRAHKIARECTGDYPVRISIGLATAWMEWRTTGGCATDAPVLTAKTQRGQAVRFNYGDPEILIHYVIQKKSYFAEAMGRKWSKLGIDIPSSMLKDNVNICIVEQDLAKLLKKEEFDRKLAEERAAFARVMEAPIIGFYYKIGCDCGDTLYFVYRDEKEVDFSLRFRRQEAHEILARTAARVIQEKIPQNIEPDLGSYGGWDLGEEILPIVEEAKDILSGKKSEAEKAASEKAARKEQENASALAEAKRTGKNVYIRNAGGYDGDNRYPGEELGWVNVVEMATPDGRIVTEDCPSY